jgi:hypothetical protein
MQQLGHCAMSKKCDWHKMKNSVNKHMKSLNKKAIFCEQLSHLQISSWKSQSEGIVFFLYEQGNACHCLLLSSFVYKRIRSTLKEG